MSIEKYTTDERGSQFLSIKNHKPEKSSNMSIEKYTDEVDVKNILPEKLSVNLRSQDKRYCLNVRE